jgi:hypothetical protein
MPYLEWKNKILNITLADYHTQPNGNFRWGAVMWSRSHPYLANLYKKSYENGRKIARSDHLDQLDELGLLIWYLDSGHYDNRSKTCWFTTRHYTIADVSAMMTWFREKWGITGVRIVSKEDLYTAVHGNLHLNVEATKQLLSIIYPIYTEEHYEFPSYLVSKFGNFAAVKERLAGGAPVLLVGWHHGALSHHDYGLARVLPERPVKNLLADLVRQIAGLIARRIITDHPVGTAVQQGERLGMIRFGSRVDLFLPTDARVLVQRGMRTTCGLTVVARWN